MKQIKTVKVDGITTLQLFTNGKFIAEVELSSQFKKQDAVAYLKSL